MIKRQQDLPILEGSAIGGEAAAKAVFALGRFGMGPRPGSVEAIAADQREALLAELDHPPAYPAGATSRCGPSIAGALFVGPDTSCPFAKNVAKAWLRSGGPTVRAFSPVTGRTYLMHCTSGTPHVCRGGINALVVFYY